MIRVTLLAGILAGAAWVGACGGEARPGSDAPDRGEAVATEAPATENALGGLRPINGTSLFVREVGQGDPLLVVHGGPGMEHSYLVPGIDVLAQDAQLVLYDQRGTGRSLEIDDASELTLDAFLADIDGVRASLGREQIDVLAHSWGALLGLLYAARYPERVRSLVLVGSVEPGQRFAEQSAERASRLRTASDAALIDSLARSDGFATRDPETVSRLYWAAFRPTFADRGRADGLRIAFTELTARRGSDVAAGVMGPLGSFDFWSEVASIEAPTLIVHGAADPSPLEVPTALREAIPGAELVVLEDSGHFPFLEEPQAFREAVGSFLARLPSLDREP